MISWEAALQPLKQTKDVVYFPSLLLMKRVTLRYVQHIVQGLHSSVEVLATKSKTSDSNIAHFCLTTYLLLASICPIFFLYVALKISHLKVRKPTLTLLPPVEILAWTTWACLSWWPFSKENGGFQVIQPSTRNLPKSLLTWGVTRTERLNSWQRFILGIFLLKWQQIGPPEKPAASARLL